jgi:hypothetical protein
MRSLTAFPAAFQILQGLRRWLGQIRFLPTSRVAPVSVGDSSGRRLAGKFNWVDAQPLGNVSDGAGQRSAFP